MTEKRYNIAKTFNVEADASLDVVGYAEDHPMVPKQHPYFFRKDMLGDELAWWSGYDGQSEKEALFFWGPTGSGKTSLWLQTAARLKIPTHATTGHMTMEFSDLVGMKTLIDGDVLWQDGVLTSAMRYGHPCMINEVDAIRPEVLIGLNDILDGAPLVLTENGGEIVNAQPGFRVIFTGNTAGNGDVSGGYQGTMRMNAAFRDRCVFIYVGYTEKDSERKLMSKALSHIPEEVHNLFFDKMIDVANHVRDRYENKNGETPLDVTFSTRTLLRWARMVWYYRGLPATNGDPVHYALDRALGFSTDSVTRQSLHEITQKVFG